MLIRDNTARAKQVISIFWIMLGITVVNLTSLAWRYFLLTNAQKDPSNADMKSIETSDLLIGVVGLAYLAIFILAIVFFIMWFRRAYYNLHTLPWHNARYTEGWAAGSWFIPVINLWWPYQIMMDIWWGIQNALRDRLGEPQSASIVGWWWALHLITRFSSNIAGVATTNASDVDSLLIATKLEFVSDVISIPAILVVVQMIRQTSNFEKELLIHSQTPADSIFSDNYTPPVETTQPKLEN
jgi:hypothetical protein